MKRVIILSTIIAINTCIGCGNDAAERNDTIVNQTEGAAATGGQENVADNESQQTVVKIAMGSKDHSTLVAAIKQAELVTALSNAGPFTVFAPTNAAFEALPAGTVESLMTADKKDELQNILQYHVAVSVLKEDMLTNGQTVGMVNGDNITIGVKDGKITVNGKAHVIASIPASNGIIYVTDAVLLPPSK